MICRIQDLMIGVLGSGVGNGCLISGVELAMGRRCCTHSPALLRRKAFFETVLR